MKVIIAEDDFRIAQIHEEYLRQVKGMELVGKALNARETLNLLSEYPADLLLLDVYMPDRLGTDLLMEIREKHRDIDIILITAATDKEHLNKALKFGVQHYLIKPVTMETFVETMEKYKQTKKLLDSLPEVNQEVVNRLFGGYEAKEDKQDLPAGIDYLTLKKVSKILKENPGGLPADKVGEKMGASRTTARRYLEYLVSTNQAYVEQEYGVVGRPERNYHIKE
ncbi:transcriptional regulator [Mesobacillus campisalis]|uniref:Transcriptional regulator n=1 Tax=Mesobacillus campisalis TaxID=1408103 RepID=A0A0M2SXX0_9BACI|nr:transcriptional regulator [Mesobacillus campisalis]